MKRQKVHHAKLEVTLLALGKEAEDSVSRQTSVEDKIKQLEHLHQVSLLDDIKSTA